MIDIFLISLMAAQAAAETPVPEATIPGTAEIVVTETASPKDEIVVTQTTPETEPTNNAAPAVLVETTTPSPAEADAASAAPSRIIRAGEHGSYSRIVIPDAPQEWSIKNTDRAVAIAFPAPQLQLDLSQIDQRRKAHRVLRASFAANTEEATFTLALSCDCDVKTMRNRKGALVIDIHDPAASEKTPPSPTQQARLVKIPKAPSKAPREQILPENTAETKAAEAPSTNEESDIPPDELRAARDRMIALLAAANDHGVIDLKHEEEIQRQAYEIELAKAEAEKIAPPRMLNEATAPCPDIGPLIDGGGAQTISYDDVMERRQELDHVDRDNQANIEAELGLAYLRFGFFAEASALATTRNPETHPQAPLISGLAALGLGEPQKAEELLHRYRQCGGYYDLFLGAVSFDSNVDHLATDDHYHLLRPLVSHLRAPIGEALSLKALETDNMDAAKAFYEIAKDAYQGEETPGMIILSAAMPEQSVLVEPALQVADASGPPENLVPDELAPIETPKERSRATDKLIAVAQTPGPYQARALGVLAEDFNRKAVAAYDGFLDDLVEQNPANALSQGDIDAAISGARALARSGRTLEALGTIAKVNKRFPETKEGTVYIARAIVATALASDDEMRRLKALTGFFNHQKIFGDEQDDHDMRLAIGRELAAYGAPELTEKALEGFPRKLKVEADAVIALARFEAGETDGALYLSDRHPNHAGLATLALRAAVKDEDRRSATALGKTIIRSRAVNPENAQRLWRGGAWKSATESFSSLPDNDLNEEMAAQFALAAMKSGHKAMPAVAQRKLSEDLNTADAIEHMYAPPPRFSPRNLIKADAFLVGLEKETSFIRQELGKEAEE